ncbi:hypothetical protein NDU88_002557 [Pleurodeles waltl]|uniref:Secreted protein n=1 Tax=Pleurodeles waltl TaxID=8319 RepID=A0AAV7Q7B0_PLEWA|nr:hypothetical protein NDU88_002557 [Pleurodeles waltl]
MAKSGFGVIMAAILPQWQMAAYARESIITAMAMCQGLWMSCAIQSMGRMLWQCAAASSNSPVSGRLPRGGRDSRIPSGVCWGGARGARGSLSRGPKDTLMCRDCPAGLCVPFIFGRSEAPRCYLDDVVLLGGSEADALFSG